MRTITACRACGASALATVLDLGEHRLSDFRPDPSEPPSYPLEVVRCGACTLVQLRHSAPPGEMYHDRYSFKSGISEAIRNDLHNVVSDALAWHPHPRAWLDIASNDGTLLSFVPRAVYRVGIDPLEQFAAEAREHADDIVVDFFAPEHFGKDDHFDVITSVSMFYDLDDPAPFVQGVRNLLSGDGVWIIQQNYLLTMLQANSIDNISHEHLAYYSLGALIPLLERYGLEVNHVTLDSINGGCMRTFVTRTGARPVAPSVAYHLANEEVYEARMEGPEVMWDRFAKRTTNLLDELRFLVRIANDHRERVYVYGASTRGGTIWQAAGLDVRDLPKVVERNPAKVGAYMSSIGAPIISEAEMRADPPEWLLVGPWWLADLFAKREADYLATGGKLIIPLPELRIIEA